MSQYHYSPLSSRHDSVRLLRLLPHQDRDADIQCELFEYVLENSCGPHLYEALSYVWGDAKEQLPIFIHGNRIEVTSTLHTALVHLRNHSIHRVLWIDAICIDQQNQVEKEHQIQFMATVYSQAYRVLVWLGEAAADSDLVFREIQSDEAKGSVSASDEERIQLAGLALLQRPWFRRVWVLQEVAAARNIVIMCGHMKIDGYAFCLGVEPMNDSYKTRPGLQSLVRSVTYLIKGAIFRPDYLTTSAGRSTLNISPLGVLVDMYHAHDATKCHDKVFALLGMSKDDLSEGSLTPNYSISWGELLQRLVKHIISDEVSVETWGDDQAAVIKSKGCILGEVISVENGLLRDNQHCVTVGVSPSNVPIQMGDTNMSSGHWTIQATATSILVGDFICLLRGTSKPSIIRLREDYFTLIVVAITFPEETRKKGEPVNWSIDRLSRNFPNRDFLLIWDWENFPEVLQSSGQYDAWVRTRDWGSEQSKLKIEGHFPRATRAWNVTLILGDLVALRGISEELRRSAISKMEQRGRRAVLNCELAIKHMIPHASRSRSGHVPLIPAMELTWAGHAEVADLLLTDVGLDPNLELKHDKPKPLAWAGQGGHDAVVELLLNSMREPSGEILLQAAQGGYTAIVRLVIQRGKVNLDFESEKNETALWLAAQKGHEAIVRLLLETGKVDVEAKDVNGDTPLSKAITYEREAVARLLLATGNVDVNTKDSYGQPLLAQSASMGQEAMVKLLLETRKVEINVKDSFGQTALAHAARKGHEAVVRLLLKTGKVDIHTRDTYGHTPLSRMMQEQEAPKLTQEELDRVENDFGYFHQPLNEGTGHKAIMELLLEAGKAKANLKDNVPLKTPRSQGVAAKLKRIRLGL